MKTILFSTLLFAIFSFSVYAESKNTIQISFKSVFLKDDDLKKFGVKSNYVKILHAPHVDSILNNIKKKYEYSFLYESIPIEIKDDKPTEVDIQCSLWHGGALILNSGEQVRLKGKSWSMDISEFGVKKDEVAVFKIKNTDVREGLLFVQFKQIKEKQN